MKQTIIKSSLPRKIYDDVKFLPYKKLDEIIKILQNKLSK